MINPARMFRARFVLGQLSCSRNPSHLTRQAHSKGSSPRREEVLRPFFFRRLLRVGIVFAGVYALIGGISLVQDLYKHGNLKLPIPTTDEQKRAAQKFKRVKIVSKEYVSPTSAIYTVRYEVDEPAGGGNEPKTSLFAESWERGIWSFELAQPQLQIARSYTPLPPLENRPSDGLRFLLRREFKGEVSNYIDKKDVGSILDLRGPTAEFDIPQNVKQVVFLAGGTGIAPALQAAYTLIHYRAKGSKETFPEIHILWANRRREDCIGARQASSGWGSGLFWNTNSGPEVTPSPLMKEMQALEIEYSKQVKIDYFIDEEGTFIDQNSISRAMKGASKELGNKQGSKLLLVAGPEGFVNHFAGPKQTPGGVEIQGPITGQLRRLNLDGWKVVKL